MEAYAYSGTTKSLNELGYSFQKLYANNYKTYHKDDVWMYPSNKMILEINNTNQSQQISIIDFILKNKDKNISFWSNERSIKDRVWSVPKFVSSLSGRIYELNDYATAKINLENEIGYEATLKDPEFGDGKFIITDDLALQIIELSQIGLSKIELK